MSKRTQFRNQHRFRQPPKAMADALLAAQVSADVEPDEERRKFIWTNALYGVAEWWKYKRLKARVLSATRRPHQGEAERGRRRNKLTGVKK